MSSLLFFILHPQEIVCRSQIKLNNRSGCLNFVSFQLRTSLCVSERAESPGVFVCASAALVCSRSTLKIGAEIAQQLRQREILRGASQPNYLVLQSPSLPTRQKWIPSPLWGEQQIGEISPNNHRYLFRRREADIYHWGKDLSSERIWCVCKELLFLMCVPMRARVCACVCVCL